MEQSLRRLKTDYVDIYFLHVMARIKAKRLGDANISELALLTHFNQLWDQDVVGRAVLTGTGNIGFQMLDVARSC